MPRAWGVAALAALAVAPACSSGGGEGDGGGRLRVVTTVSPITSMVSSIGGERVVVDGVVPEGTNSHTFEPPPSVARALSRADVVYLNGLGLEEPTRRLAARNLRPGAEVVALGDRALTPAEYVYDQSFPREGGRPNPHLWTNPLLGLKYAGIIRDDLSRRDPANAPAYAANYEVLAGQVGALDRAVRAASATIPTERRRLLTYHDSFPYFAREYGWTVIGAIQPSDFDQPTPREVAAIIRQVRDERVPAIFGSEVFPSPVLEQIGRETGARYVDELRDDDLPGDAGDPEHSWLGLLRFDFVTMVAALGGDPAALEALPAVGDSPGWATYAR
ncbi:MAG: metal ABC transporter substrate-binding protein [Acidimicrobiales bacterium]